MRLFYKHLLTSIRRHWVQPLILTATILLSVIVCTISFAMSPSLINETTLHREVSYGKADIMVSLSTNSDSRFMFAADAEDILGDDCQIAGLYELPILLNAKTVMGAATDLFSFDRIFSLQFTAGGTVCSDSLADVCFISYRLAEETGLCVGDTLNVTLLNKQKSYTVAGVTATCPAGSFDILLDITAVTRSIAAGSPFLSSLGDKFRPTGKLYIDLPEQCSTTDALALLTASSQFADKSMIAVEEHVNSMASIQWIDHLVTVVVLLAGILAGAVTYCCFSILAASRSAENAVFIAAGASSRKLSLTQYVEALLYFAVGAPIGLLLSYPALKLFVRLAGFQYSNGVLTAKSLLFATLIQLFVVLASVAAFSTLHGRPLKKRRKLRVPYLLLLPLAVALFVAMPLVPHTWNFVLGMIAFVCLFLLLFFLAPPLLRLLLKRLISRRERHSRKSDHLRSPALYYAMRNTVAVPLLQNSARLMAVLLSIMIIVTLTLWCGFGFQRTAEDIFNGDYAIVGASERCLARIEECSSVKRIDKIYFSTHNVENKTPLTALSASNVQALTPHLSIKELPKGNEALVSREVAGRLGISEGDIITMILDKREIPLTVKEIVRSGIPLLVFDCEANGISYNMLLAEGGEGTNSDALYQELTAVTSSELVGVVPTNTLLSVKTNSLTLYISIMLILLAVIFLFAVVGILDNLFQSYQNRKEEFMLYTTAGMSHRTVRRMKALEILIAMGFALLLALLVTAISSFLLQYTLYTLIDFFKSIGKML